jgi:hypothetical protein
LEPLRRLPGSGCFLFHALNAYPNLAKNPYQIFSILPTSEVANFEHPWKTTSVVPDGRSIFPFTAHDSMDSESFADNNAMLADGNNGTSGASPIHLE